MKLIINNENYKINLKQNKKQILNELIEIITTLDCENVESYQLNNLKSLIQKYQKILYSTKNWKIRELKNKNKIYFTTSTPTAHKVLNLLDSLNEVKNQIEFLESNNLKYLGKFKENNPFNTPLNLYNLIQKKLWLEQRIAKDKKKLYNFLTNNKTKTNEIWK